MTPPTFDVQAFARGIHELLVLAVLRGGARHGYQIALDLAEWSGGLFHFKHGTLYPILHRLESDGRIAGEWTEGGRPRKVYRLTAEGERVLEEERVRLEVVVAGLVAVVEEGAEGERAAGLRRGA